MVAIAEMSGFLPEFHGDRPESSTGCPGRNIRDGGSYEHLT
jgi:hypothetical protein